MKGNFVTQFILCLILGSIPVLAKEPAIIPRPQSLTLEKGSFTFKDSTKVYTNKKFVNLQVLVAKGEDGIIFVKNTNKNLGKEAYLLQVSKQSIRLEASEQAGIFYATQSLLQSMPKRLSLDASTVEKFKSKR